MFKAGIIAIILGAALIFSPIPGDEVVVAGAGLLLAGTGLVIAMLRKAKDAVLSQPPEKVIRHFEGQQPEVIIYHVREEVEG